MEDALGKIAVETKRVCRHVQERYIKRQESKLPGQAACAGTSFRLAINTVQEASPGQRCKL